MLQPNPFLTPILFFKSFSSGAFNLRSLLGSLALLYQIQYGGRDVLLKILFRREKKRRKSFSWKFPQDRLGLQNRLWSPGWNLLTFPRPLPPRSYQHQETFPNLSKNPIYSMRGSLPLFLRWSLPLICKNSELFTLNANALCSLLLLLSGMPLMIFMACRKSHL